MKGCNIIVQTERMEEARFISLLKDALLAWYRLALNDNTPLLAPFVTDNNKLQKWLTKFVSSSHCSLQAESNDCYSHKTDRAKESISISSNIPTLFSANCAF